MVVCSEVLGVGSWLKLWSCGLVEVLDGRSRSDSLANLTQTRNPQWERKETKVKERKDVKRLGGFSSHRGFK